MQEKVQKFLERYEELEQELSRPDVAANPEKFTKLHKSFKALEKTYTVGSEYMRLCGDFLAVAMPNLLRQLRQK